MAENILRKLVFGKPVDSILVVDTVDTDAGPIVEHLIRRAAENLINTKGSGANLTVNSAGIAAEPGSRISARALAYLEKLGVDASKSVSQRFAGDMARGYQLTLTCDMAIKGIVMFLAPGEQVYTVSEYSLTGSDLLPMEQLDDASYAATCSEIEQMVKTVVTRATRNTTF